MDDFNFLPTIEISFYSPSKTKEQEVADDPDIDIWVNKSQDLDKFDYNKIQRYFNINIKIRDKNPESSYYRSDFK